MGIFTYFSNYVDKNSTDDLFQIGIPSLSSNAGRVHEVTSIIANLEVPIWGNYSSLRHSGLLSPGFWVNGTQLALLQSPVAFPVPDTTPNTTFPFTRFAQLLPSDGNTYLYHQINVTTFAEEQFDFDQNYWVAPKYFSVSDD